MVHLILRNYHFAQRAAGGLTGDVELAVHCKAQGSREYKAKGSC